MTINLILAGLMLISAQPENADPKNAITALTTMQANLDRDAGGFVTAVRLHPQGGSLDDTLPHLRRLTRLSRLALHTDNLSANGFLGLAEIPTLIEVELRAAKQQIGPSSPQRLATPCPRLPWDKLPKLRTIRLSEGGIGDAQLEDVAAAQGVQNLFLVNVVVTDQGLTHLRGIRTLERLNVQRSKVTADGVKAVVGIENLKSLTLSGKPLEPGGFQFLGGMTGLEYLSLESTGATDADMAHLAALAKLTHLNLGYNPDVTDAGLKHLTGLRRLTGLLLYRTNVTDDGVAELKGMLPKLMVGK